jgi:hypothetical protein
MKTAPCPHGDKGICTIPDSAIVVRQGRLQVAPSELVTRHLPDFAIDGAQLRRLDFAGTHADIAEVADSLEARDATVVLSSPAALQLESAIRESGVANGVIVTCSCGDVFIAEP